MLRTAYQFERPYLGKQVLVGGTGDNVQQIESLGGLIFHQKDLPEEVVELITQLLIVHPLREGKAFLQFQSAFRYKISKKEKLKNKREKRYLASAS